MISIARDYVAGTCNIGPQERLVRLTTGWIGATATVALEIVFLTFDVPRIWRTSLFFTAYLAAVGFLQGYLNFCVQYALRGTYNVSAKVGQVTAVTDAEHRKKDRSKSMRIFAIGLGISSTVAAAAYFLP